MKVTNVEVRYAENCGNMKATANVTLDDAVTLKEVRVMNGVNGFFVGMPSKKCTDGKYREMIHIESEDLKKEISKAVLEAYWKLGENQHRYQ